MSQSSGAAAFAELVRTAPRDLWLLYLLKYLESYSYFVLSYILILFLSDEFDLSDEQAGFAYGVHGMLISVYGFFMGAVIDSVGVKWSVTLGMMVLFLSRISLVLTTNIHALMTILFVWMPLGCSLGVPVIQIGIKKMTLPGCRVVAYSIFYFTMNLAAITAAPAVDAFRTKFTEGVRLELMESYSPEVSAFRLLILTGACVTFCSLFVALTILRDVEMLDDGTIVDCGTTKKNAGSIQDPTTTGKAGPIDNRNDNGINLLDFRQSSRHDSVTVSSAASSSSNKSLGGNKSGDEICMQHMAGPMVSSRNVMASLGEDDNTTMLDDNTFLDTSTFRDTSISFVEDSTSMTMLEEDESDLETASLMSHEAMRSCDEVELMEVRSTDGVAETDSLLVPRSTTSRTSRQERTNFGRGREERSILSELSATFEGNNLDDTSDYHTEYSNSKRGNNSASSFVSARSNTAVSSSNGVAGATKISTERSPLVEVIPLEYEETSNDNWDSPYTLFRSPNLNTNSSSSGPNTLSLATLNDMRSNSLSPTKTTTTKGSMTNVLFQDLESPLNIYSSVLQSPGFWRFFLLISLLLGVKVIFRYLDALFPKYMLRELGPDAMYGTVIALNPLCILILVPAFGLLTSGRISSLNMILVGATIASVAPFWLVFGHSYTLACLFILTLSIGEACWSPRVYEYTMSVAEPGKEGTYTALANAPMFCATLLAGGFSGVLLDRFCPETGRKNAEVMWLFIGMFSILSPIGLYLCKNVIAGPAGTGVNSDTCGTNSDTLGNADKQQGTRKELTEPLPIRNESKARLLAHRYMADKYGQIF